MLDPSLRAFGMARSTFDWRSMTFSTPDLRLLTTSNESGKTVRKNSDDLRRARELLAAVKEWEMGVDVVFSEIPSGSQSARSSFAFGIMIGVIASIEKPLIQVMPTERGKVVAGRRSVTKDEVITWATGKYPDAPWLRLNNKPAGRLLDLNEHLADAVAIGHAGVLTDQFKGIVGLSTLRSAA